MVDLHITVTVTKTSNKGKIRIVVLFSIWSSDYKKYHHAANCPINQKIITEANIMNKKQGILGILIPFLTSPVIILRFFLNSQLGNYDEKENSGDTKNPTPSLIKLKCGTNGAENAKNVGTFGIK